MDSTFNELDDMGMSLVLSAWAGPHHSNWVLQKEEEIHDCVGISCEGLKEQFKTLLTIIEAGQHILARSFSEKERELKRLSCSINYDVREGSAS